MEENITKHWKTEHVYQIQTQYTYMQRERKKKFDSWFSQISVLNIRIIQRIHRTPVLYVLSINAPLKFDFVCFLIIYQASIPGSDTQGIVGKFNIHIYLYASLSHITHVQYSYLFREGLKFADNSYGRCCFGIVCRFAQLRISV